MPAHSPQEEKKTGLFIGLTYIDVTVPTKTIPKGDEKAIAQTYEVSIGGNAMVAALTNAKLGQKTYAFTPIAEDFLGRVIREKYKEYAVTLFERSVEKTSLSVVLPNGNKRAILRCRNTNFTSPYSKDLPLEGVGALHLDAHQPDAALYYAKKCRNQGILTSLDGGGIKEGILEILPYIDVAVMSERFSEQMAQTPKETISWLQKTYTTPVAAVTLGEKGLLFATQKDEVIHMPALPLAQEKVVDTTGAGDIFHGAYIASYLQKPDAPWEEHFAYGRAASTLSIQKLGTESSIPSAVEVQALLNTPY